MDYLGSVPLSKHSSDLMSLQDPLKELYFKYLKATAAITEGGHSPSPPSLPGTVEISKTGLKVGIQNKATMHNNNNKMALFT